MSWIENQSIFEKLKEYSDSSENLLKPVALLIKSTTGYPLPSLASEIEDVGEKLCEVGFEVQILEATDYQKIGAALDSSSPFFGRIALLHYAGHSSGEGLEIGGKTEAALLEYGHLLERLKRHDSLRLLFLNSCQSDGFTEVLENALDDTVKIMTSSDVSDELASQVVSSFYYHFLSTGSSARESVLRAKEAYLDRQFNFHPEPKESRSMLDEQDISPGTTKPPSFPWKVGGSGNDITLEGCRLAVLEDYMKKEKGKDKESYIPWGVIAGYFIVFLCCAFFAFSGHLWKSSPAFQAAFSYGPSITEAWTGEFVDIKNAKTQSDFDDVLNTSPVFGAIVETVRSGLLCFFAVLIGWRLYNPFERPFRLPRSLESRGLYKSLNYARIENPWKFRFVLSGFIIVVLGTVVYHKNAPRSLKDGENRWNMEIVDNSSSILFKEQETLWKNASTFSHGIDWSEKNFKKGNNYHRSKHDEIENFRELFFSPYWWYSPYSFCMFCLVAYPILIAIFKGVYKTFTELKTGFVMLEKCIGKENRTVPGHIVVRNLEYAKNIATDEIKRFLFIIILIMIAAGFEAFFGHYTLAKSALGFTLFAALLILSASIICVGIVLHYDSVFSSCKQVLVGEEDQLKQLKNRELYPIHIIRNPMNIFLWVSIIGGLAGLIHKSSIFSS